MLMRVLLYDTRNGLFLQPDESWKGDHRSALDFGGNVPAVNLAFEKKLLNGTAVMLSFDDPSLDMLLPLETDS
jgi:hypothetical protein